MEEAKLGAMNGSKCNGAHFEAAGKQNERKAFLMRKIEASQFVIIRGGSGRRRSSFALCWSFIVLVAPGSSRVSFCCRSAYFEKEIRFRCRQSKVLTTLIRVDPFAGRLLKFQVSDDLFVWRF